MGCRTQINGYYAEMARGRVQSNNGHYASLEGTAVRKAAPEHTARPALKKSRKKNSRSLAYQKKIIKRQQIRLAAAGVLGAVIFIGLCGTSLMLLQEYTNLFDEVSAKETEVDNLTVYNDALKYEIDSAADYAHIIQVATEELGMVRMSQSQIVTYSSKDTEYIQQVASVPTD